MLVLRKSQGPNPLHSLRNLRSELPNARKRIETEIAPSVQRSATFNLPSLPIILALQFLIGITVAEQR